MKLRYSTFIGIASFLGLLYTWISLRLPPVSRTYAALSSLLTEKSSDCSAWTSIITDSRSTSCTLVPYAAGACDLTHKLFLSQPPADCSHEENYEFCRFSKVKGSVYTAYCNLELCKSRSFVGYFDVGTGENVWSQEEPSQLAASIDSVATQRPHSGYLYIVCDDVSPNHQSPNMEKAQLLLVPVELSTPDVKLGQAKTDSHPISFNFIFIDSVSYEHFVRSMPKSVSALKKLETQMKVLRYPMFQSLKSRTFENLQALFSGEADTEQSFGTLAMPSKKLQLQSFFKPLLDAGYSTLWLEDLCWTWEWGISKDLLVHSKRLELGLYWQRLRKALAEGGIQSLGISPSSCEILKHNGRPDPFHDLKSVCFGGRHQHEYLLSYLQDYQTHAHRQEKPYATFFETNVGHDDDGRRIQTLDQHLSEYLKEISSQPLTLTIVLSDHGNAYGQFVQQSEQGRRETYHPLLYLLLPPDVEALLGPIAIGNLEANQRRLATVLDFHLMLRHISPIADTELPSVISSYPVIMPRGLLDPLPWNRSCDDLPLFKPNICICQEKEGVDTQDGFTDLVIAEFAVGMLNRMLFAHTDGSFGANCRLLIPVRYSTVSKTRKQNGLILTVSTNMDLHFQSPLGPKQEETIFANVQYSIPESSAGYQLITTERVSVYSIYRECNDGSDTETLCICQRDQHFPYNSALSWMQNPPSAFHALTTTLRLDECLHLFSRRIASYGFSIYAGNICDKRKYEVTIAHSKLVHTTSPLPIRDTVAKQEVKFLVVLWDLFKVPLELSAYISTEFRIL